MNLGITADLLFFNNVMSMVILDTLQQGLFPYFLCLSKINACRTLSFVSDVLGYFKGCFHLALKFQAMGVLPHSYQYLVQLHSGLETH